MTLDEAQVPDGWQAVRLGDVAEVNRRQWDPSSGSTILYLDLTSVAEPGRLSAPQEIPAVAAPSRARRRVQDGDILVSTVRPYLRGFARVIEAPENLIASTGFAVLTPQPVSHGSLLYHHVMSPAFVRHLEGAMTGQAYPAVRPDDVASYPLALPPLPEQRAIAAVLDGIDEAIERPEEVIAATERLRDALLHELLTRGLPGRHSEWVDVPGLGTVPACWDSVRLGDVCAEIKYGTSRRLSTEGALPVLRIPNVAKGLVDLSDLQYADLPEGEARALSLDAGDLLLVRTNGNPDICGTSVVWPGFEGQWAFASYLLRLRTVTHRLDGGYLWAYLRTAPGRRQLRGNIRTSAGNYNLSAHGLTTIGIPLPPLDEQHAIVASLDGIDDAIGREREERARLQSLQASVADALLTGQVRVTGLLV